MKIVIAGAGEVGCHLAKLLSRDNMEITLIDEDRTRLGDLENLYDLKAVVGSPTSLQDLKDIPVANADLFVAVTPSEAVNMNACILAHKLGAKRTLARIDNSENLTPENKKFYDSLGINQMIYPEELAGKEISESLRTNWMRYNLQLSSGDLELCVVKVRSNAEMINRPFMSDYFAHGKYRVVAIKREEKTFIPRGSDCILTNDLLFIICKKGHREMILEQAGKNKHKLKNVIVYGGTRIAEKAIEKMPSDMNIKLIEPNLDVCEKLSETLSNTMIIHGNGSDFDFLKEQGIDDADAFVAVTGNSETNIFACLAAKDFGVRKTIAEVENIDYIHRAERLDIGTVLNKKIITASYIYQLLLDHGELRNVQNITSADAQLVEFQAAEGSKVTKHKVSELYLPANTAIGALVRAGVGMLVNGETRIVKDDIVVVFCKGDQIREYEKLFE